MDTCRLDAKLRADQAARFLTTDGLWHQWIDGPPRKERHTTPDNYRQAVSQLCVFANESTARQGTDDVLPIGGDG
ncbi:DUF6000 family protein [Streptomyces sp. NPDC058685]|uniref:DUF6000 family protein n=1 Tax=Streptomyces sp. NPDC058685 TaxID=3346598 RepID=UPI00365357B8